MTVEFSFARMIFIGLWLFFPLVCATPSSGVDLECYNDYEHSSECNFSPGESSCSEFTMEYKVPAYAPTSVKSPCIFKESKCQCAVEVSFIGLIEQNKAQLWNAGVLVSKLTFNTTDTIKPKVPTTPIVKQTENGNYLVSWETDYNLQDLTFYLTYRKKGEKEGVSLETKSFQCQIPGSVLKPGSDYVVSVRALSGFSNIASDSSGEVILSTPAAPKDILTPLVIVICIFAVVIVPIVLFWCFFRLKDKLWNIIPKYAKPDLLYMLPAEPRILSPQKLIVCSIYVDSPKTDLTEGKQWSNCSSEDRNNVTPKSGSGPSLDSSLGYAQTCPVSREQSDTQGQIVAHVQEALARVFPNLAPAERSHPASAPSVNSAAGGGGRTKTPWSGFDEGRRVRPSVCSDSGNHSTRISGSTSYDNMTYLGIREPVVTNTLPCESDYHPSGKGETCPQARPAAGQPDLHFSPVLAPLVQTDFSYHPCDHICASTSTEDDIVSSEMNAPAPEILPCVVAVGYQSFGDAVNGRDGHRGTGDVCGEDVLSEFTQDVGGKEALICDVNPCYIRTPTPEPALLPTEDAYQALQSVVQHGPACWTPA